MCIKLHCKNGLSRDKVYNRTQRCFDLYSRPHLVRKDFIVVVSPLIAGKMRKVSMLYRTGMRHRLTANTTEI